MIAIASDHAALSFKLEIAEYLKSKGLEVRDFGAHGPASVDYADYAFPACEAVVRGECEKAILICGTGQGMAMSANKVRGIRAVVCTEPYSALLSRLHNDSNVLALGARVLGIELAKMIVDTWLDAKFEGGRHAIRIGKIKTYEDTHAI